MEQEIERVGELREGGRSERTYKCDGVEFMVTRSLEDPIAQVSFYTPVPTMRCGGVWQALIVDGDTWFRAKDWRTAERKAFKAIRANVQELKNEVGV